MKELFDKFLMYFCFAGIGTIAVVAFVRVSLPAAATKARGVARKAKKAGPAVIIPVLCVAGLIVYGSTKGDATTRERVAAPIVEQLSNAGLGVEPSTSLSGAGSSPVRPCDVLGAPSRPQSRATGLAVSSPASNALVRVEKWWRRGAYDDGQILTFDEDWCFPYGTNHLTSVEVWASGAVYPSMKNPTPIAGLVTKLSLAPHDTEVFMGRTANNTYRIEWHDGHTNRNTNQTADASIELFRNGDVLVTENGVTTEIPYEIPFEHDGFGQDEDWIRSNYTNAEEILSVGYTNWVHETVCANAPNGLFCLNVVFDHNPEEIVQLSVGDKTVAVNTAGVYSFLLPKGERHGIEMSFVPEGTDFTYYDAFTDDSASDSRQAVCRAIGTQNIHTEITASGSSAEVEVVVPNPFAKSGRITWIPFLSLSPDHLTDPSYPIYFNAYVDLPSDEHPTIRWTSDDGSISDTGEWLTYDGSATAREIYVIATYKEAEMTGHISIRQIVSETRIALSAPSVIVVEDPYTNRPNEVVVRTSNTVKMTASWELAQSGRLRLEVSGSIPTRVCFGDEADEITSFPYDVGSFSQHENGSLDFYLTSTNMNATGNVGNYRLRFIPDEGAEYEASAGVRIVKIRVEADADWPSNKVRHVFGPKELVHVRAINSTSNIQLTGSLPDHGQILASSNDFHVPDQPGEFTVNGTVDGFNFSIDCTCIAPTHLRGESPRPWNNYEWMQLAIRPLTQGEAGVVAHIDTFLEPSYISFRHVRLFEGFAPPVGRQGWYLDTVRFPDSAIGHTATAGASVNPATQFATIGDENKTHAGDYIGSWIGSSNVYSNGSYRLEIPLKWYTVGCTTTNSLPNNTQTIWVYDNGAMRVNKNGISWQRELSGLEYEP